MKKIIETSKDDFLNIAFSLLKHSNTLLDIGCGIVPHAYVHHNVYIACEPYTEYVKILKKNRDELSNAVYLDSCVIILNEDWESLLEKYENYTVDTVYLIDVIEHLPKDQGRYLLKKTEKMAKKQIVIFTPLEYIEQKTLPGNKDAWGLNGADWQEHKSVWTPSDFDSDEWTFVICKDYHETNNIGEVLDKPVGAFWAIKDIKENNNHCDILENKEIQKMYEKTLKESLLKKEILISNINNIKQENINLSKAIDEKSRFIDSLNNSISNINNIKQENINLSKAIDEKSRFIDSLNNSNGYKLLKSYWSLKEKIKKFIK